MKWLARLKNLWKLSAYDFSDFERKKEFREKKVIKGKRMATVIDLSEDVDLE